MSATDEVARYIIPCLVRSPQIVDYHRELVDAIADRFGLTFTQRQRIPAHFTLKYHFTTSEIERVEELLGDLASRHAPAPVEVGGFGHFGEDVVFVSGGVGVRAITRASIRYAVRQHHDSQAGRTRGRHRPVDHAQVFRAPDVAAGRRLFSPPAR